MSNNGVRRRGRPRKDGAREANGRLRRSAVKSASKQPLVVADDARIEVEQLVAVGESQAVIADAIGCTVEQLTQRYGAELLHGHARRRREVVGLMFAKARAGNATLIRELNDLTRIAAAEREIAREAPRAAPLGKKAEAKQAAETAGSGTEWGSDLGGSPPLQ